MAAQPDNKSDSETESTARKRELVKKIVNLIIVCLKSVVCRKPHKKSTESTNNVKQNTA